MTFLQRRRTPKFAQNRQRNNEGVWFPSLRKLFTGTTEFMRLRYETHEPWFQTQVNPRQLRHQTHDWKFRVSGWYNMIRFINLRLSWQHWQIDSHSSRLIQTIQDFNPLVVPNMRGHLSLNVNLVSCVPNYVLIWDAGFFSMGLESRGNKRCLLQPLGNLFLLEVRLQSKSRCLLSDFPCSWGR